MHQNKWENIKKIFNIAIDLTADERLKYLERECGEDEEMLSEINSLLTFYNKSGNFLETSSVIILEEEDTQARDVMNGETVGKYRIEDKLGEGGMAVVYSASRIDKQFKRKVAVKFIKRGMDTEEIIRRFKFEQQALADLSHPYIARIIDGGTTENGLPYFVMEPVYGVPVNKYCESNKLSTLERINLFLKICEAVKFAHQNLIVHRDLKPQNIFVTQDGNPKLLDFGIAKLLDTGEEHALNTRAGVRLMTLDYASPEQLAGKTVTTATDVYSLGVILYELLTDHSPYDFKSNFPTEKENIITTSEPEKPSSVIKKTKRILVQGETISPQDIENNRNETINRIRTRLTGDLDNIILKALQKDPERRYSSVEQFAEDISRSLNGLPVIAHKDSIFYRSSKFIERHKTGVLVASLILILLIAGMGGIIYQSNIANKNKDLAEIEARKAERINSFLQEMLASPDPSREGSEIKVVDVMDDAGKKIKDELEGEPEVQSELRKTLGITYQGLGFYEKAIEELEEAVNLLNSFESDPLERAAAYKNLAVAHHYNGDYEEAESYYRKSISLHENIPDNKDILYAEALNDYGTLKMDIEEIDSSLVYFRNSLSLYLNIFGKKGSEDVASVLSNIGLAHQYNKNLDSAEYYLRRSLKMNLNLSNGENFNIVYNYNNLAFVYHDKNDLNGAREMFSKSLEMRKKLLRPDHPQLALAIYNLGCITYYSEDHQASIKLIEEAQGIWDKTLEPDHPYFGNCYYWLGKNYNSLNQPKKAEDLVLKALEIRRNTHGANENLIALTNIELGRSYLLKNEFDKAETIISKNLKIIEEAFGEDARNVKYGKQLLTELNEKKNNVKTVSAQN